MAVGQTSGSSQLNGVRIQQEWRPFLNIEYLLHLSSEDLSEQIGFLTVFT